MQFRDLGAQYKALKPKIDAGIQAVIDSSAFILGKPVTELENKLAEYVGRKHCVACANGTEALQLALMAWDIGPGDAVFTSDFTYFASAGCASIIGATPVLVDIDLATFNMSPEALETEIQRVIAKGKLNPKAIIPVDLFGLSADFTKISAEYPNEKISYGDIIVSANKRHKIIKYTDIYSLSDDQTYAAYGYTTSTVTGNNIENALTGAISYVLSDKTIKVAFLTGHSSADLTADYKTLLSDNNYEIDTISDNVITKISSEYDSIVIPAPTTDFLEGEIKVLSEFLDNDSKLGKGLVVFADAAAPYLNNLYDFLEEWGILIEDGVVLETDANNYMPDEPTTIGSYSTGKDDMTADMRICISGDNVPITASFDKRENLTVTSLIATPETAIAAPKGSGAGFDDANSYEKKSYSTCIMSEKLEYLDGTKEAKSHIFAFSSTYFLASEYNEASSVANKNLSLVATERACGSDKSDISFVTKSIENESFADSVTQGSTNLIIIIFMVLLPLAMIVSGIVIFIKRRNS